MNDDYLAGHLRPGGHPSAAVRDSDDVRVEQHRLPQTYAGFARLPDAEPDQVAAVIQTLAVYGHALDNGDAELLQLAFAEPSSTAVRPSPSHHTVNTQVKSLDADLVAWSRLVTIAGDGSVASADALDRLTLVDGRWKVVHRTIHPRHGGEPVIADGSLPW